VTGGENLEDFLNSRKNNFILDKLKRDRVPFGIIHPSSTFKIIWNIILLGLLLYTATIMPFRMAFVQTEPLSTWFFIEVMIDVLFGVDVYVNSNSAYYD
jgi:hypothetical protein